MKISLSELTERAKRLMAKLAACDICPRNCKVNRLAGELGYCQSGAMPIVASHCVHYGEEPVISGTKGSGTVFFSNCNLRCVFCQNHQISQNHHAQKSITISLEQLANIFLSLQNRGCHNVNLVSPSHFVPQILQSIAIAATKGFALPLVYNTNGYEKTETLGQLEGIIDIYLPDLKYADNSMSQRYSGAHDYVENARQAIQEMFRQVGILQLDEAGIAKSGVIVRHLLLPNDVNDCQETLKWLARSISPKLAVSLMSQYYPSHHSSEFLEIDRKINTTEYQRALAFLSRYNMENGWMQNLDSSENYLPDFNNRGNPFDDDRSLIIH